MATLSEVRNATVSCKPGRFTPYYNMNVLVTTGDVLLQNGETLHYENLKPHSEMTPNAATFLARDAEVIALEIFNALITEEAADGETSLGDRIVAANNAAPPLRRTPNERANDRAKQASLVDVVFQGSDLQGP